MNERGAIHLIRRNLTWVVGDEDEDRLILLGHDLRHMAEVTAGPGGEWWDLGSPETMLRPLMVSGGVGWMCHCKAAGALRPCAHVRDIALGILQRYPAKDDIDLSRRTLLHPYEEVKRK